MVKSERHTSIQRWASMKAFAQLTLLCWRHSILNLLDRTWLSNKPETATTWMKTAQIVQTAAELASLCRRLVLCAAVTGNCPLIKVNWTQKLVHPNAPRLSGGVSITDELRLLAEVGLTVPAHPGNRSPTSWSDVRLSSALSACWCEGTPEFTWTERTCGISLSFVHLATL